MALFAFPSPAKKARIDNATGFATLIEAPNSLIENPIIDLQYPPKLELPIQAEQHQEQRGQWQGQTGDWQKTWLKTAICKHFLTGTCKWGTGCNYAHGEAELNTPINNDGAPSGASGNTAGANPLQGGTLDVSPFISFHDTTNGSIGNPTPTPTVVSSPPPPKIELPNQAAQNQQHIWPNLLDQSQGAPHQHRTGLQNPGCSTPSHGGLMAAATATPTIPDMIKIVEETADWLVQAATYCTNTPDAAEMTNVINTAVQALQRLHWAAGVVMATIDLPGETVDAAEKATIRNKVIESKQKAEVANLTIQQLMQIKNPLLSNPGIRLAAQQNQVSNLAQNSLVQIQNSQAAPEIRLLNLAGTKGWSTSQLAAQGYHPEGVAVVHQKGCDLFAESHYILQIFCGSHWMKSLIEFEHDAEASEFPEVYEAWKKQGGDDWPQTVAKCKQLKKWAVGFGGRKNGEKTAKLALALCIAGSVDQAKLTKAVVEYPAFGKILTGGSL